MDPSRTMSVSASATIRAIIPVNIFRQNGWQNMAVEHNFQVFECFGFLDFFGFLNFWIFQFLDFLNFCFLNFLEGFLNFRVFEFFGL